ncbi:radical SAM (seleno)protein TrsS [Desulfofalx alkaliphila]|uniref:radical SAM (seleno)protein TrsS n=1 Tax=Desulfofalx alkaliphila TaxID=105483 RepID=UPI0004E0BFE8|nr:radical SAM (seleno)protein TrsS [Desulfofalx alkaliphila]
METASVCPLCLKKIPARREMHGNSVFLVKECQEHGTFKTILWRNSPTSPDYQNWARPKIPSQPPVSFTEVKRGCPFDCGLCPDHRQHSCTVLLEITARCNLGCAFCFANAGDNITKDADLDVIKGWYEKIILAGGPYNIQLSGGEPTVRDDLPEIISMGRSLGFNFIQLNTNGLRLAEEPSFVKKCKDAGLTSVFLQFDGTDDEIYTALRGRPILKEKLAAIEHCAENNIGVVLVPTLVPGVNLHNIGAIIDLALNYLPTVRGVHFQPVSYFGRYPQPPGDSDRITIPEVIKEIASQSKGRISMDAFKPPGCENALCSFHGNFILMPHGELRPWTKHEGCCGTAERAEKGAVKARKFVAKYWSAPEEKPGSLINSGGEFALWDLFIERSRTHSFSISGMAFQDAWNLDLERLRDCCIHVMSQQGKLIPFCAYNLTNSKGQPLYR